MNERKKSMDMIRVLVAEDNEMNQELLKAFLEIKNLDITMVKNGIEVIEAIKTEKFDFIIMDVQMPGMDGLEATKILRGNGKDLPIVAVTAYAMKDDKKLCLAAGMDYYIPKPIDIDVLFEVIDKIINKIKCTDSTIN